MFDTAKIQRMTALLEKIPSEFDDVYLIPERHFYAEAFALFKRLKIPIRGIMYDTTPQKEIWGFPVVKTAEVSSKFNERTALIILVEKPVPFIQTTFDFKVRGGTWTIPSLVISDNEINIIYNRLIIQKLLQIYEADSILEPKKNIQAMIERFAGGLMTFLNPQQNFKYQFWDNRAFFKPTYDFDDTAIVIQGPIAYDNNYTVETFKLYRSIYPNVPIVVSTWQGEATNNFRRECKENSIILLENEPPEKRGLGNVNMQLKSSLQGIKYVKENTSAKFVLKTRTDQCINYFSFLIYFKNLLETFPPKDDKLHSRIIFIGSPVHRVWPFYPHDFLAFGYIEDIYKLYDIPLHAKQGPMSYFSKNYERCNKIGKLIIKANFDYNFVTEQSHKLFKLNKMVNRIYWPEMYITRTFYEKYIAPVDATKLYETSWKFTADYLILIDFNTIQLDWLKYENMRYKTEFLYGVNNNSFVRWLDMYRNFKIDWV